MRVLATELAEVRLLEPNVFPDPRGSLLELWNRDAHRSSSLLTDCVLDLVSVSVQGVLRGLHHQWPFAQAKLVSCLHGEVFDVAVDVRPASTTFGRWTGALLSHDNRRQLFIPKGFAHGFAVLSAQAVLHYKLSERYRPDAERIIAWNDPAIGITWPLEMPLVSERDARAPLLASVPREHLPNLDGD